MNGTPPETAPGPDAAEDRRRDEVLCRLLNTPYQPNHRPSTAPEPVTARPVAPAPELADPPELAET